MELYKILTLVIIMNLGLSMAMTFQDPHKNWEDWATNNMANWVVEYSRNLVSNNLESENVQVQQNENQLIYTGGMSIFMLVNIVYGIIENVAIGGLKASIGMVISAWGTGNSIINVIAWSCTVFISMLYVWIGMKMYTWIKSNDTQ